MPLGPAPKKPSAAKPTTRPIAPPPPKAGAGAGLPVVDPTKKPTKPAVDAKEFQ